MSSRVRDRLSDEAILDLIECGVIEVDLDTGEVYKQGSLLTPTICGTAGKNGQRYRIEICWEGAKRSIIKSKLVYMAGSRKIVPEGYEVHHIDEDKFNDNYANLICLSYEDHRKLHGQYSTEHVPF